MRRALDLAIDRRRLIASLATDALPVNQLVPRFVLGHNPDIPEPVHDPRAARALLAEAGFGGGFAIVLHARPFFGDAADSVRDQLREVGITVETRLLTGAEYYAAAHRRDLSFWIGSFGCATGDASEILSSVIHSTDETRHRGSLNAHGYVNPALDRGIEATSAIENPTEAREALKRLMRTVTEERVLLPLFSAQDGHAIDRRFRWRPRNDGFIRAMEIEVSR